MNYLETDVDPKTLKITELRKILNFHNVPYSSDSKKATLVEIYNKRITPERKRIVKEHQQNVENLTDKDFIDADSNQDKTMTKSDSDDIIPPSEDDANDEVSLSISSKRTPPKKVRKQESSNDSVTNESSSPKNTKSTPNIKSKSHSKVSKDRSISKSKVKSKSKVPESLAKETESFSKSLESNNSANTSIDPTTSFSNDNIFQSFSDSNASASGKKRKHEIENANEGHVKTKRKTKNPKSPRTNEVVKSELESQKINTTSDDLLKNEQLLEASDEEAKSYDETLRQIQAKTIPKSEDLKELGITIQGFQPPTISSSSTPKRSVTQKVHTPKLKNSSLDHSQIPIDIIPNQTRSSEPKILKKEKPSDYSFTKSAITPKPRLISIGSTTTQSLTDDDDEIYDNDEVSSNHISNVEIAEEKSTTAKSHRKPILSFNLFVGFFLWIFVVAAGFFGYWYYEQQFLIGYCGQEIERTSFEDSDYTILRNVGQILDTYCQPQCKPCPTNARCFPNLTLGCFEDYVEFKPWFDFVIPGRKKCIPDTKKAEKINIMIDVALDLLRTKNANVQCGKGLNDHESGIQEKDLHDLLLSIKAPYITNEEFEELWSRSVTELAKEPDVIVRQEGFSNMDSNESSIDNKVPEIQEKNQIFRSTSLSNISLNCQIQNSIFDKLIHYKLQIFIFLSFFVLFKYVQYKYNRYKLNVIKINIIYEEVLSKLIQQSKLSKKDHQSKAYIGSNQLRDLILKNEENINERTKLWKNIIKKVENNTNVSHKIIESHGEIIKVWEWISDLHNID